MRRIPKRTALGMAAVVAVVSFCALGALGAGGKPVVRLTGVEPWWDREAEQLANAPEIPAGGVVMRGGENDWCVAAVRVEADGPADIVLAVSGSDGFASAINLKVAGEVQGRPKHGKPTWWLDPLFSAPMRREDLGGPVRNWGTIRDFPRLHLRPGSPVLVWITARTQGLAPGEYAGALKAALEGGGGAPVSLPLRLTVLPYAFPTTHTMIGHAWTTYGKDEALARIALDYGINSTGHYDDWDKCRKWGFRYFRFNLPGSQLNGASLEASDDDIRGWLQPIRDTVKRLSLTPREWAIEVYDEPCDLTAWAYAAWAIRIRRLWPEAQIWANPGYNPPNGTYTVAGTVNPLAPYVTTWCPYIEYVRKPEFMKALRATKAQLFYYTVEFRFARPATGGRDHPWLAWRLGLDGWAFYNLAEFDQADPWKADSCARMYPGHTVSLWLEGLRQGVQDCERLALLERRGVPREKLLSAVLDAYGRKGDAPWGGADPSTYHAVRDALDRLLCTGR